MQAEQPSLLALPELPEPATGADERQQSEVGPSAAPGLAPAALTRAIVAADSVAALEELVQKHHVQHLNGIHVAAALVKLAKLVRGGGGNNTWRSRWRSRSTPPARRHPQRSRDSAATRRLAEALCATYVTMAASSTQLQARQHANVCWALGTLAERTHLEPADSVICALEGALLASDAAALHSATPQELSNTALGLVKLGRLASPLLPALCAAAMATNNRSGKQSLAGMKPQELSNLAWAAARAQREHTAAARSHHQHQHQQQQQQQQGPDSELAACVVAAATIACPHVASYMPVELVNLLWACAAARVPLPVAVPLFTAALPLLCHQAALGRLNGQDMGNAAWAYATLQLDALGQQLLAALQPALLAPQEGGVAGVGHESCTTGAFGSPPAPNNRDEPSWQQQEQHTLEVADKLAAPGSVRNGSQTAASEAASGGGTGTQLRLLHACTTQELCNLLWATAALQCRHPGHIPFAVTVLREVAARRDVSVQGAANSLWAAARLGALPHCPRAAVASLLRMLAQHIGGPVRLRPLRMVGGSSAMSCRHALECCASCACCVGITLLPLHVPPQVDSNPAQHAAITLWACTRLPAAPLCCAASEERSHLLRVVAVARAHLHTATPAALAQLSWAAGWAAQACQPDLLEGYQLLGGEALGMAAAAAMVTSTAAVNTTADTATDSSCLLHHVSNYSDGLQTDGEAAGAPQHADVAQTGSAQRAALPPQGHEGSRGCYKPPLLSSQPFQQGLSPPPQPQQDSGEDEAAGSGWQSAVWLQLADEVADAALPHLAHCSPQELSVLAQGLSYALRRAAPRPLFRQLGDTAVGHVVGGGFSASGLSGLLAAFVRAGVSHGELAAAAARSSVWRLRAYAPPDMANLMWALACMRVRHMPLLDQAAAMLLSGPLAHSPHVPNSGGTQHHPTCQMSYHMPRMSPPATPNANANTSSPSSIPSSDTVFTPPSLSPSLSSTSDDSGSEDASPRASASSLLKQLGWEEGEEEADEGLGVGGATRTRWRRTRQQQQQQEHPSALPWAAASPARAWNARVLQAQWPEPARSSPAMVWAVLAWSFARSSYHQHQLYRAASNSVGFASSSRPGAHHQHSSSDSAAQGLPPPPAGFTPPPGSEALGALRSTCLVQLVWAYALQEHPHRGLLRAAGPVLAARILQRSLLNPREVATVAWAYARLQHYEPLLFRTVLWEAMTHADRCGLRFMCGWAMFSFWGGG